MTKFVSTITHEGRDIVLVDCANQGVPEMLAALDEMLEEVLKQPRGQKVLILMNMVHTPGSLAVNRKGQEIVNKAHAEGVPDMPTAIVGFTGAQRIVVQMFASMRRSDTLFACDTIEEAKEWLVKH